MGKQKKHLLILLLLLIVIIAGCLGLREFNRRKAIEDLQKDSVRAFNNTEIEAFTYTYATKSVTIEKQDGIWVCPEKPSLELDVQKISAMLNVAANMPYGNVVENVTDFEQYGLTEPYLTIVCSDGEKEYTILMGDYSDALSQYFIRVNNEDKVYTVDSSLYYSFTKSPESLAVKSE